MSEIDSETLQEIDDFIEKNYGPEKPAWILACRDVRKRCIIQEYGRLTKTLGLKDRRAREILARLINRSPRSIENILYR
jgi:hypothetical protein